MNANDERLDRLYQLLPAVHRMRDTERGGPLRALLQVITEQANIVEDDIRRLYDNWFIETCDDWVVPYLADLIGFEPVHEAGQPGAVSDENGRARNRILIPRREVANTIHHRRRKGTLALLELLTRDVAGWPARAVEFYRLLARTQSLRAPSAPRGGTVALRESELARLGGPFDGVAHTIDVRRIQSRHTMGSHNIPSVGVFVWRLEPHSITRAPACCLEEVGPHWYSFSALGNDVPLFTRPQEEASPDTIAGELHVPHPISRRAFAVPTQVGDEQKLRASPDYYGVVPGSATGQSLAIWAEDWPTKGAGKAPIPASQIIPADLSGWMYTPPRDHVAVDPELGRIAFPPRQLPKKGVWVSYHYGFSAEVGGGEYTRPLPWVEGAQVIRVQGQDELRVALELFRTCRNDHGDDAAHPEQPQHAIIEIADSGVYVTPINIFLGKGHTLTIRAAQNKRPVLRLVDWQTERPDSFAITGLEGSRLTLDGVVVAGRGLQIQGCLGSLTVRHSTLVPGWALEPDCEPRRPAEPSIELVNSQACVVIEHSIVGSIQVNNDQVMSDPVPIRISDSVLDATGSDCDRPECEALGATGCERAHATLRIARSTVVGRVQVHAIELAENSIFLGCVSVARSQLGCMRFCYVCPCSRTPRRYHCQPDLVERAVLDEMLGEGTKRPRCTSDHPEVKAALERERSRVRPQFTSLRYGTPGYCQLGKHCADEIARGAEDESEMGVFHDLFQPQRLTNLRARLAEYTPSATDVGIILVT